METFEVRSKSFTVKWSDLPPNSQVKWEIKPLKNSINLGIYKYKSEDAPNLSSSLNATNLASALENLSVDEVNQIPHKLFGRNQAPGSSTSLQTLNGFGISSASLTSTKEFGRSGSISKRPLSDNSGLTRKRSESGLSAALSLEEKLDKHLTKKKWIGRCPADEFKSGVFTSKTGGLYAFVFDNTFSKTKAKKILFAQETEVFISQPQSQQQSTPSLSSSPALSLNVSDLNENPMNGKNNNNNLRINTKLAEELSVSSVSNSNSNKTLDSISRTSSFIKIPRSAPHSQVRFNLPEGRILSKSTAIIKVKGIQFLQGFLLKKKRRRSGAKNFTKRYFSLNFNFTVLDYYSSDNSNNIRGNMLITQTVISADKSNLMMYLDSGMEQWVLKALNKEDFNVWIQAFDFIKKQNKMEKDSFTLLPQPSSNGITAIDDTLDMNSSESSIELEERNQRKRRQNPLFQQVRAKLDEIKILSNDLLETAKYEQQRSIKTPNLEIPSNVATTSRRSSFFWKKRKESISTPTTPKDGSSTEFDHSNDNFDSIKNSSSSIISSSLQYPQSSPSLTSATSSPSSPTLQPLSLNRSNNFFTSLSELNSELNQLDDLYQSLLQSELDRWSSLSRLRSESRKTLTRTSTGAGSILSQDFYDAQDFLDVTDQGVVMLNEDESDLENNANKAESAENVTNNGNIFDTQLKLEKKISISSSEDEEGDDNSQSKEGKETHQLQKNDSEPKNFDLKPLPFTKPYNYRKDIKPAACDPPSLISIFRKGLGKDLSSIAMPVSCNEPLSFLQKYSETFEYANLINDSINLPIENGERILNIAVFAMSYLAAYRDKIRSIRKPFNPLLGETFELIRPELGIRLITEKIIHKPFIMAAHVDSKDWYISNVISPQQKFYGKTAEIYVQGKFKLIFRKSGEIYEWEQPTTVLRNMVSFTGDKYTEPIDSMTIKSNTGFKSIVSFLPETGRFSSGRSEKISIKIVNEKTGKPLKKSASGTWTGEIKDNDGKVIWRASKLVDKHEKKFGFTEFSCSLNNIDEIHKLCSPTDSRKRPDQKLYENGETDEADELKLKLEEDQRLRRKDAEGNEVTHKPAFFVKKGEDELDWEIIHGEEGYWNRRQVNDWNELIKLW